MTGTEPFTREGLEDFLASKGYTITGIARVAQVAGATFMSYLTGGRVRAFEATKINKVCREVLGLDFAGEVYRPGSKKTS